MPAIPYTKTAVDVDGAWDGPGNTANLSSDAKAATLRKAFAWVDPTANADTKGAYKFIHHEVSADGTVGDANYKACSAGIAVLNGGRGGANIPDADRQGVYDHLASHIKYAKKVPPALNSFEEKHEVGILVTKNAFVDNGDGSITFPNKLVITDNSMQKNGTCYDINSMDLGQYNGKVTADHVDMLNSIIAKTPTPYKVGNQVVIDSMDFAINTAAGRLAYNLLQGGFLSDFSIETYGPPPDETGTYYNANLVGLSAVVVGNNNSATVNKIVMNSLEESKKDGLDTAELEEQFLKEFSVTQNHSDIKVNKEQDMKYATVKNSRTFAVKVAYKNAAGDEVETELNPGAGVDVDETQTDAVEKQITDAVEPTQAPATPPASAEPVAPAKEENAFATALAEALKPMTEKMEAMEKQMFDKAATVPAFTANSAPATTGTDTSEFARMGYEERHSKQINAAWDILKHVGDPAVASTTLNKINETNLAALKSAKNDKGQSLVRNSLTIADFGNFVISPELLTQIQGCRNNYTALVNATNWKETLSLQMAWLARSGDINMSAVEMCDDGENGNLKPISTYSANIETSNLEELAAVTPVCNSATRFLAADLLGDVAQGYQNDYNRKQAQLIIARLEQAIDTNGNSVNYNASSPAAVDKLNSFVDVWTDIATCTPNGSFVFNVSTLGEIMKQAFAAGTNGPLSNLLSNGPDGLPTVFGRPYVVVPDDLMPTLGTNQTKTVVVDGVSVTINHAVFYFDPNNFTGRTSGGLMYDLSTDAAYEDSGTVKSAFQRNELVLRGSFFRGGAILDVNQVSALLSPGVS